MNKVRLLAVLLSVVGLGWLAQSSPGFAADPPQLPTPYPAAIQVLFVCKDQFTGNPILTPDGHYEHDLSSPNPRPVAFENDYLPNVVAQEIGSADLAATNLEARKAQAVAARGFAWHKHGAVAPLPAPGGRIAR